jgi:hypothetical protein
MTKAEVQREVMELPEDERLEVADAIWASLDDLDAHPLPSWQRDLLSERLASAGPKRVEIGTKSKLRSGRPFGDSSPTQFRGGA